MFCIINLTLQKWHYKSTQPLHNFSKLLHDSHIVSMHSHLFVTAFDDGQDHFKSSVGFDEIGSMGRDYNRLAGQ